MEWFIAVVIVAALGVAAVAAAGGLGGMAKEPVRDVYRQDLPDDRQLVAADINGLRFGTALRGYAMDQVDDILDRLGREIAERDGLIARLRAGGGEDEPAQIARAQEGPAAAEATDDPPDGWSSAYEDADPSAVHQPDEVSPDYR
jgi:DivIVA domain-containing protein